MCAGGTGGTGSWGGGETIGVHPGTARPPSTRVYVPETRKVGEWNEGASTDTTPARADPVARRDALCGEGSERATARHSTFHLPLPSPWWVRRVEWVGQGRRVSDHRKVGLGCADDEKRSRCLRR